VAKKTGLSFDELLMMDLGQVMDFIIEYSNTEMRNQERAEKGYTPIKRASQSEFDAF
jgi:hypothetical protein